MPLRIWTGNSLEDLVGSLANLLRVPLSDPLPPELVAVPSRGLARWVAMEVAERLGISANLEFPFPDQLVREVGERLLPDLADSRCFEPDVLAWRVYGHLPVLASGPNGQPLEPFVASEDPAVAGIQRYQLARRLADTFELYTVFRPALLADWEAGAEPDDWQATLWRSLNRECPGAHRGAWMRALGNALPQAEPGQLPERVSIFGLGTLAPSRLDFLAALGERTEVHLFCTNPSRQYWADIRSSAESAREARRRGEVRHEVLAAEIGNPLLASFGRLGRDFFDHLAALPAAQSQECFQDPLEEGGEPTLLRTLQSDILNLRHRGVTEEVPAVPLDPGDASVQIHACHSPVREVEVLHDQLLAAFREIPDLEPRDVLVATPDIETYAPYIRAVFDGCPDEQRCIPYSIADRSARATSPVVDAFVRLLSLPGSRYTASQVLDLLDCEPVRERFGLSDADRDTVAGWVRDLHIRWGRDAEARSALGLPAFGGNSWRAGLERLLLGYALPGDGETLFDGILPYPAVEGDAARVLGGFLEFAEALFTLDERLGSSQGLAAWSETLLDVVGAFFLGGDATEPDLQTLRDAIAELGSLGEAADLGESVPPGVLRTHLAGALEARGAGGGYLRGAVTVCALRPLRSIPFRVVALVGMNDGVFPRVTRPPGFDRMARDPKPGDPTARDEDRYLFLECLLAARDRFTVSYVGQSVQDNSPIPPSVAVSELLDAVAEGFRLPDAELPDALITRHRLQAFHPAYFTLGSGLASAASENLAAVRALCGERRPSGPWVRTPLPAAEGERRTLRIPELARFFTHPARAFVQRRMGIRVGEDVYAVEETEPFEVAGLERYHIESALVERVLDGADPESLLTVLRAEGRLPPGRPGEVAFEALCASVQGLVAQLEEHRASGALPPLEVDLSVGDFRVHGRLSQLWADGMLRYRPSKMKAKAQLEAWLEHLVLNAAAPDGHPRTTVLVCRDEGCVLAPVGDAKALLARFLDRYWGGLCTPLPLFPETSAEYHKRRTNPKHADRALGYARTVWEGSDFRIGERDDDYFDLCFGNTDPLDEAFQALALDVFDPLARHRSKR